MTQVLTPPPDWEILEVEGDPDFIDPSELRFQGPNGEVLTLDEMVARRLIGDEPLLEAAGHTGAMIALFPAPPIAQALALSGGEDPAEIHMTLAFLGDIGSLGSGEAAQEVVRAWAAATPELAGEVSGIGHFEGNKDGSGGKVCYASVDLPELPHSREQLVTALAKAGLPASSLHGFTPHMTLDYRARRPTFALPMAITFDRVTLAWGDERYSFPLGGES